MNNKESADLFLSGYDRCVKDIEENGWYYERGTGRHIRTVSLKELEKLRKEATERIMDLEAEVFELRDAIDILNERMSEER